MTGQPLIYTHSGKPSGCGVRIVGIEDPLPGQREFRSFDVSVNIYAGSIAVGKAIGVIFEGPNPDPRSARRQPLYGAWFRARGDAYAVAPLGKSFGPSEDDSGGYLFQSTVTLAADFVIGVIREKPIQVAIRWQEGTEVIYAGRVKLTAEEQQQIAACVMGTLQQAARVPPTAK
jgi:hypothetical protein